MSLHFGCQLVRVIAVVALLFAGAGRSLVYGHAEKSDETAYQLGQNLYRAGDCLAAIPSLKSAVSTEPRANFALGKCYLDTQAYAQAADSLAAYLLQFPSDIQAVHLLAIAYEKAGRNSDALNVIHYYVARHADDPSGQVELGRYYLETGDKEKAAAAFSGVLEKSADDPAALLGSGLIASADGRWAEAAELLKRSSQLAPGAPATFKALGDVYARQGKCEEALGPYGRAFELRPSDYPTAKSLAKCYAALNKLEDVARVLRSSTLEEAKDIEATQMVAKALAGNAEALAEYANSVIALNPDNTVARSVRAQALLTAKQTNEAIAEYLEILKVEKDHPDAEICYKLATLYEARGDLKSAHQYYTLAAASPAATSLMHLALARTNLALNDPLGAQGELGKVGAPESNSLDYKILQVEVQLRSGNWDSANSLALELLQNDPQNVKLLDLSAQIAGKQERYEDEAALLERLYQASGTDKRVRYRLARLYIARPELKQEDRAMELLKDFTARQETDPEGYLLLGYRYQLKKDATNTRTYYELGFARVPNPTPASLAWAYVDYAAFLGEAGDLQGALEQQSRAVQLNPDDEDTQFNLGVIDVKLKKFEEVKQVIEKLQVLNPKSADDLQGKLNKAQGTPPHRSKQGPG